jgi:hypothetical protein
VDSELDTVAVDAALKANSQDDAHAKPCAGHFLPPLLLLLPPRDTSAMDGVQR